MRPRASATSRRRKTAVRVAAAPRGTHAGPAAHWTSVTRHAAERLRLTANGTRSGVERCGAELCGKFSRGIGGASSRGRQSLRPVSWYGTASLADCWERSVGLLGTGAAIAGGARPRGERLVGGQEVRRLRGAAADSKARCCLPLPLGEVGVVQLADYGARYCDLLKHNTVACRRPWFWC